MTADDQRRRGGGRRTSRLNWSISMMNETGMAGERTIAAQVVSIDVASFH